MRTYLTVENLKSAAVLGLVVGFMAVPRILDAEKYMGGSPSLEPWVGSGLLRVLAVFPAMTLVAGTVTAWGKKAGMCGPFPDESRTKTGVVVAVVAGLAAIPFLFWLDFKIVGLLHSEGHAALVGLALPSTVTACLGMMLWSAGFETLFFRAGTMSFLARVSNRQWVAVAGAVALRVMVSLASMSSRLEEIAVTGLVGVAVVTMAGCLLYARAGLVPAMAFAAVMDARHLFRQWFMTAGSGLME